MIVLVGEEPTAAGLCLATPSKSASFLLRRLRGQQRIRLHIHLFSSFMLTNVIFILWDLLIVYNRLVSPATESRMRANTVGNQYPDGSPTDL